MLLLFNPFLPLFAEIFGGADALPNMKEPVCLQESSSTFIVKWIKPRSNCIKVNIDGDRKGNPGSSGGGGVIRNDDDDVVCAFSEFYGDCSKNMAEAKAMLQGIIMCKDRINEHIIVKTDSQLLVNIINNNVRPP